MIKNNICIYYMINLDQMKNRQNLLKDLSIDTKKKKLKESDVFKDIKKKTKSKKKNTFSKKVIKNIYSSSSSGSISNIFSSISLKYCRVNSISE